MDKIQRIKELVNQLNIYRHKYIKFGRWKRGNCKRKSL